MFRRRSSSPIENPEDYWVQRGDSVIGVGSFEEVVDCRQVDTYRAIYDFVEGCGASEVLDLGCNVAVCGQLLRHWGYAGRYWGVDNNIHALRVARGRVSSSFANANIRRLPFASHSVPTVVMKDVLEHMEAFEPCLEEALRIARDHAIVANFIPWSDAPPKIHRERHGFYLNRYNSASVIEFMEAQGWTIDQQQSMQEKDGTPNEVFLLRRR